MQLSVPLGTILFYYAEATNEALPAEYAYCEGQNLSPSQQDIIPGSSFNVPDLRNRFLMGADRTKPILVAPNTAATDHTGAPGPMRLGGQHLITLGISNVPAHSHSASSTAAGGSHGHSWYLNNNGSHTHGPQVFPYILSNNGQNAQWGGGAAGDTDKFGTGTRGATAPSGNHAHNVYVGAAGAHSHNISVSTTGSSTPWDGRQRHYALVYVMKVKN